VPQWGNTRAAPVPYMGQTAPKMQVDETPPHHAMYRRAQAAFERRRQRRRMDVGQPRRLARGFAVDQADGALGGDLQHPVPDDWQHHAANRRRLGTRRSTIGRRKRQQAPGLRCILRGSRHLP
jgi:hypothetical protein